MSATLNFGSNSADECLVLTYPYSTSFIDLFIRQISLIELCHFATQNVTKSIDASIIQNIFGAISKRRGT